jgi:Cdc6-like AAA superfamily ATPase
MTKVAEHNENKQKEMIIPKDKDGNEYELRNLTDEQFEIAFVVLDKIREWLDIAIHGKKDNCEFKPLRLTVMGQAGTGKTVLINTLVTVIRKKLDSTTQFTWQHQQVHRHFLFKVKHCIGCFKLTFEIQIMKCLHYKKNYWENYLTRRLRCFSMREA